MSLLLTVPGGGGTPGTNRKPVSIEVLRVAVVGATGWKDAIAIATTTTTTTTTATKASGTGAALSVPVVVLQLGRGQAGPSHALEIASGSGPAASVLLQLPSVAP